MDGGETLVITTPSNQADFSGNDSKSSRSSPSTPQSISTSRSRSATNASDINNNNNNNNNNSYGNTNSNSSAKVDDSGGTTPTTPRDDGNASVVDSGYMSGGSGSGSGSPAATDNTNVFVKYLPSDVGDRELHQLFAPHGVITSCKVMIDHNTGSSLGYGFVRFSTTEEAYRAITLMNGYKIHNKALLCKFSNAPSNTTNQTPSSNLYIKPLLTHTTEDDLRNLFAPYGTITEVKVMIDKRTGASRQIGFVRYTSSREAARAIDAMNGIKLDQDAAPLIVKFAESEQEKAMRRHRASISSASSSPGSPSSVPGAVAAMMVGSTSGKHSQQRQRSHRQQQQHRSPPQHPLQQHSPQQLAHQIQQHQQASPLHQAMQMGGSHLNIANAAHVAGAGGVVGTSAAGVDFFPVHQAATYMVPPYYTAEAYGNVQYSSSYMGSPYHPQQMGVPLPPPMDLAVSDETNLFVFHLPAEIDDAGLCRIFAQSGQLESVRVIRDKVTGISKGYGFVKYVLAEDAARAIQYFNGIRVGNKHLKVSYKTQGSSSPLRGPSPGGHQIHPSQHHHNQQQQHQGIPPQPRHPIS